MPVFSIIVGDTVEYARWSELQITADTVEEAKEKALEIANCGIIKWQEEQIDNTPYWAELAEDLENDDTLGN